MKPMDQAYIDSRDIANRYMQGKLCSQECEEFEVYLMENSDMVDKLRIDSMFIKTLPLLAKKPAPQIKLRFWQSLFATPSRACLATFCGSALLCLLVFKSNQLLSDNKSFSSPSLVYVSAVRGNTVQADASLSLNDISSSVSLVLQDDFDLNKEYQINMFVNSSTTPIHTALYKPNNDMEVVVSIDKEALQPGLMEIQYSLDLNSNGTKSLLVAIRD